MGQLVTGTTWITSDEPAFALAEVNLVAPDFRGRRRYQIIYVNRGDRIAEFRKDLGAADSFKGRQFRIPALWLHTVGELREMADNIRDKATPSDGLVPEPDEATIRKRFHDMEEAIATFRRGRRNY